MKLAMTLLARDEADIIAANVEYHLAQGVDLIVATANNSEDGTYEILEGYARDGHMHVIWEPSDDYDQGRWVTRMARLAATEYGADWVMNADADEFWWPRVGTLKDVFAAIPDDYGLLYVPTNLFVARAEESGPFWERMVVAETTSVMRSGRPHPPKVAHRGVPDVEVAFGNHTATGSGLEPVPGWQPIEIMHFPMRSYAQYERKVRNGGKALQANAQKVYEPLKVQYRLWEAGTLPEHYAAEKTASDDEVETGLRDGRLLEDRRLQRFLAYRGVTGSGENLVPGGATATAARPTPVADAEQLRVAALRAIDEQRRRERVDERALARTDARAIKAERRAEQAERGREREAKRLRALEQSAWWRLGLRLSVLWVLGPARRLAGRLRTRP